MVPSRNHGRAALGFILVAAFLDVLAMGIVIPVLPTLVEGYSGSSASAGLVNGGFVALWATMQFIASPVIGSVSDRFGRRPVILISCGGLAADYVLLALAPNLWWLALGRVVNGVTSASFTTCFAYMADITPPERRARAYGLIGAAFSAGFVAGPVIGGLLAGYGPRAPFWAAAALGGLAFLYGLLVLPESLPPDRRTAFAWRRANPFGALVLLRSHRDLFRLAGVNFLVYFAHHLFSAVFVLYTGYRFGWSPRENGLLLALWGLLDMIVQAVLVGPLVARFGDRRVMVCGLAIGAAGMAAMGLATSAALFIAALVVSTLWGLAMPTIQSLMTARVSEREQGQLQGANSSVGSIAGILSPLFFGAVYAASVGERPWFPLAGTAFILAAGVLLGAALLGRAGRGVASDHG
jgi:MFS transporter, DHA1 family, tetracycline resistance protein